MQLAAKLFALLHADEIVFGDYAHRRGLARVLGLSETTLWRMERDGDGPPLTKVRRLRLYKISAVEKWLAKLSEKQSPPVRLSGRARGVQLNASR